MGLFARLRKDVYDPGTLSGHLPDDGGADNATLGKLIQQPLLLLRSHGYEQPARRLSIAEDHLGHLWQRRLPSHMIRWKHTVSRC